MRVQELLLRKSLTSIFLILLLLLKVPLVLADSMPNELSFGNEQYYVADTIRYFGDNYQIIVYQNGDTIVLDSSGNLVTNPSILNNVYLIEGYKNVFSKYNVKKDKYSTISEALTNYYNSLGALTNPALRVALTVLGSAIGTVSLPIIGTISGPVIVNMLIDLAERLREGSKVPQSTVDKILENFALIENGEVTSKTYEDILQLSILLKNQLNDWSSQFMVLGYNVWGSLGEILYKIGDAGSNLPLVGDTAKEIKKAGSSMMESQRILSSSIEWLSTLQVDQIKYEANMLAQTMMNSQEQRIRKLQEDFNSAVNVLNNDLAQARSQTANAASQGADVTLANSLIQQASLKLDEAKIQADNYRFKTAKIALNESSVKISNARLASTLSIDIHKVELKFAEVQNIIDQKSSIGADVSSAQNKLNEAKAALSNAKSFLNSLDFNSAKNQISLASSLAEEALSIANSITNVPKSTSISSEGKISIQIELEHILLIVIIILTSLLVYVALKKKRV